MAEMQFPMTTQGKAPLRKLIEAVEAGFPDWGLMEADIFDDPVKHEIRHAFHGSLDAAKALHEALLPGYDWRLRDNRAWVWRGIDAHGGDEVEDDNFKGLPARAWLLSILRAYEDEQ